VSRQSPERTAQSYGGNIALIPWGLLFEEYLDPLDLSLEQFRTQVTDGWLFNYVKALATVGIDTTLFIVTNSVLAPVRSVHKPTGCGFVAIPAPLGLRAVHQARRAKRVITRRGRLNIGRGMIAAEADTSGPAREQFLRNNFSVRLPSWARRRLFPAQLLASEIRRAGCNGILCQEYEDERFEVCVKIGERLGIPTFGVFQGGTPAASNPPARARATAIRNCSGLIISSGSEAARVQATYGVPDARMARVPNPVSIFRTAVPPRDEVRKNIGINPNARVAVWHGRVMRWKKGLDILISAWRRIGESPQLLQLLLVGAGADSAWLRKEIEPEMESGSIRWIDRFVADRDELSAYLSAGDVYVFPSRDEGFPVAPLEAMSLGLPVISGGAQGMDEILEIPERDGGLKVTGTSPTEWSSTLIELLMDPSRSIALGESARQRVQSHFSVESIGGSLGAWLRASGLSDGSRKGR